MNQTEKTKIAEAINELVVCTGDMAREQALNLADYHSSPSWLRSYAYVLKAGANLLDMGIPVVGYFEHSTADELRRRAERLMTQAYEVAA